MRRPLKSLILQRMGKVVVQIAIVLTLLAGGLLRADDGAAGEPLPTRALESRLVQVAEEATAGGTTSALRLAERLGVPVAGARIRIVLEPRSGDNIDIRTSVALVGGTVEGEAGGLVQALVPAGALALLPYLPGGAYVRAPLIPQPAAITGEGVAFTKANAWHAAGLNGTGVEVAVIDVGFSGLAARQAEGEVPTSAVRVDRCPGRWESTAHGVAVAEVLHEVAPAARLHLICISTEVELAQALEYVKANGIKLVNHSVIWFASSRGDGQGPPGTPEHVVAQARAAGILWVNAAGNAAEKHWSGIFTDADRDGRHEFSGNDERNRVTLNPTRTFCAALKWDEWPATDENYDVYLRAADDGSQLGLSETVQDGSQPPREGFCWENRTDAPRETYLEIVRRGGSGLPRLDLYSIESGRLQYQVPEGSVIEPGTSAGALTVGAVCWQTGVLEPYSSRGPTIDGRVKPDLVGPATVSSASYGPYQDCQPLTLAGFRGSSAATPHLTGAAALLKQLRPALNPDGLTAALMAETTDLGAPGPDFLHGVGSFALRPLVPLVVNAPVLAGVRYAVVTGSVDTRGLTTSYVVEYGSTGTELRSPPQSVLAGDGPTPLSFTLEGLAPGGAFRYRIVATNAFGTTAGALVQATTLPPSAPVLGTTAEVGERSATVSVTVDPRGDPTTVLVDYGRTSSYGSRIGPVDAGRGIAARTLAIELPGLEPGTSYHYRVVATNATGTVGTPDTTLTTLTPPPPPPPPAPVSAARPPDLAVSLGASTEVVSAGGQITYRALVTNRGGSIATGVRLALTLSPAAAIQASSTDRGVCRTEASGLLCELGALSAGQAATVSLEAQARTVGALDATAEVSLDQRDPAVEDNRASFRVSVGSAARAAAVSNTPLRLTRPRSGLALLRRSRGELRTSFTLNRKARVSVTVLNASGRRLPLLAGSHLGGRRSRGTSDTLARFLPGGRSTAVLRLPRSALEKALKVRLVARDDAGDHATLVLTIQ